MSLIPKLNIDVNGKIAGDNNGKINAGVKASIAISDHQGEGIFNNLTDHLSNVLPHDAGGHQSFPQNQTTEPNTQQPHQSVLTLPKNDNGKNENYDRSKGQDNDGRYTRYENRGDQENGGRTDNNRGKGTDNASEQGQLHGQGHNKFDQRTQTINIPNQTQTTNSTGTTNTETTNNQPINNQTANNQQPVNNQPVNNQTTLNTNVTPIRNQAQNQVSNQPLLQTVSTTVNTVGNGVTNLLSNVVNQVLRQNDIYLNQNVQNVLNQTATDNGHGQPAINNQANNQLNTTGNEYADNKQLLNNFPVELRQVVQTIDVQIHNLSNNLLPNGNQNPSFKLDIPPHLQNEIQALKTTLFQTDNPVGKTFSNLNITERMQTAIEFISRQLPPSSAGNLQQFSTHEVLNGFLMARGLVAASENSAAVRNLVAFKNEILPPNVAITSVRDLGQLVKILIGNAAIARTTANLELAVQKFVRILIANNELGVMLATVSLARESGLNPALMTRTLALMQIYELIGRLIVQGKIAMQEVAVKYGLDKLDKNVAKDLAVTGSKVLVGADRKLSSPDDLKTLTTYNNLRQFLEFNPACVHDRSASAFINPDDSRHARHDFMNHCQDDINQWLAGGNHRFVKDFDLGKPLGIVIERGSVSEDYFTATKIRIVLVRDGSVQGWHFLKSFLVK